MEVVKDLGIAEAAGMELGSRSGGAGPLNVSEI